MGGILTVATNRFERQSELVPRDRLNNEVVTVIGVGAIGRQVAMQLASIGVPSLQLIDFDHVELTNVTTQGYWANDVGTAKVDATAASIRQIDPSIHVDTLIDRFRPKQNLGRIVFCCVDKISARAAIWRSLRDHNDLWIDGRMLGETIRVLAADNDLSRSHYDTTLFSQSEAQSGACTSRSTIYTASIAAGLMVHQMTRWLRDLPTDRDTIVNLLASELVVR